VGSKVYISSYFSVSMADIGWSEVYIPTYFSISMAAIQGLSCISLRTFLSGGGDIGSNVHLYIPFY
jgi:hypothetical protein